MPDSSFDGRLVVTGGSGFIGSHVVDRARSLGWYVVTLSSADIDLSRADAVGAVRELVHDGDTVVHSAAIAPTKSTDDLCANMLMTQHLVDGLAQTRLRQFIVVSSDAVYGSAGGLLREDSPTNADSLHGVMSLGRELLCSHVHAEAHSVVRPAPVYGIGDTHNSYGPNRMARELLANGAVSVFGAGANVRDHVSVLDVAAIIVSVAEQRLDGTWLAASGHSVSFADLAGIVAQCRPGSPVNSVGSEPTPTTRTYDTTRLIRAMPSLILTPPDQGVRTMVRAMLTVDDQAGSTS